MPESEQCILINGLGELAWRKGNYHQADSLFQVVLLPYQAQGKVRDRYMAAALTNLAASKQSQGRFNESLNLIRQSVTTTRALYGSTSLAYGNSLENEALLRIRLGDLAAAKGNWILPCRFMSEAAANSPYNMPMD